MHFLTSSNPSIFKNYRPPLYSKNEWNSLDHRMSPSFWISAPYIFFFFFLIWKSHSHSAFFSPLVLLLLPYSNYNLYRHNYDYNSHWINSIKYFIIPTKPYERYRILFYKLYRNPQNNEHKITCNCENLIECSILFTG